MPASTGVEPQAISNSSDKMILIIVFRIFISPFAEWSDNPQSIHDTEDSRFGKGVRENPREIGFWQHIWRGLDAHLTCPRCCGNIRN
jgi:hypothetical protein